MFVNLTTKKHISKNTRVQTKRKRFGRLKKLKQYYYIIILKLINNTMMPYIFMLHTITHIVYISYFLDVCDITQFLFFLKAVHLVQWPWHWINF